MAAGLGFKTFTTGEVLTAADTNGYLMQGVLVFASSAARASAITSPQEGQYSYLKDTDALEYYSGSAWVGAPVGDITGVTAGTGISGGGTSGTVTVTNSMATEITAAGDIIVGTGSGTFDNLPIGTTAQVLTADTTVSPYKVKWETPASGGGMTLINSGGTTLSGTTVTVGSIPATYLNLQVIVVNWRPTNDGVNLNISVNADTTANRHYKRIGFTQTDNASFNNTFWDLSSGQDNGAGSTNLTVVDIYNYANTTTWKLMQATTIANNSATPTNFDYRVNMGGYNQTGAISSLQFWTGGNGDMTSGTVYVYGVK